MGKYSIKELEHLSGIKAHTIRIWEKRYQLFKPHRTATNIRYYTDQDLKKLLNISLLCDRGTKISQIVALNETELCQAVKSLKDDHTLNQLRIFELIEPMTNFDENSFCDLYDKNVEAYGLENTLTEVLFPFLHKVGILWLSNEIEPAQEHFVSNIIRQKLSSAIDQLPSVSKDSKKALLFLPEGEYHELGLLFFNYLYKKRGIHSYYFGQAVPIENVIEFSNQIELEWVLTYSLVLPEERVVALIQEISRVKAKKLFYINRNYSQLPEKLPESSVDIIFDYRFALDLVK